MTTGVLLDNDEFVGKFICATYGTKWPDLKFDRAIGIINNAGILVGGVIFQNWNRFNVDASYYGKNTLTPGILRFIARYIVTNFGVVRVTVMTSKRNTRLRRALHNLGFATEGMQRCFYGNRDCPRNTAARLVMFRDRLNEIAKLEQSAKAG